MKKETGGYMDYMVKKNIRISVRDLVEFVFRTGDIDNRNAFANEKDAMKQGSKIHKKIQGRMGSDYTPEVTLKHTVEFEEYLITVEGRADGIIKRSTGVIIDEIKGMYKDVTKIDEPYYLHKAQAMCYAYIYAYTNDISEIKVQLTYCDLDTEEIKRFREKITFPELKEWFDKLIAYYSRWIDMLMEKTKERQESIQNLEFPFEYRDGQRNIVVSVFKSIMADENLYIQAPTGVGKTMSVLFPAVRAIGEEKGDKIFYLTAKTITATVAEEAFDILKEHGLKFRNVTVTAKEKLCILEKTECNPEQCERAKGHFDRINEAVYDIITHEHKITRETVLKYAEKHKVCPFEMNLDCTNWCDGIICDYNYVYDPFVRLKRYFADGGRGNYIVLVDEAHNMVERARDMYSASLNKNDFLKIRKIVKDLSKTVWNGLSKCNKVLLDYKRECMDREYIEKEEADELVLQMLRLQGTMKKFFEKYKDFKGKDEVLEFYFNLIRFLNIYELVDEKYVIYAQQQDEDLYLKLFCVNPSGNISQCMWQCRSTIFFSATLLPVNYYKELLSGNTNEKAIYINSPFLQEKRLIYIATDVSSRYKRRNLTEYQKMAEYIRKTYLSCKGNYMVFFPSYNMMEKVYEVLLYYSKIDGVEFINQTSNMDEKSREEFLLKFSEDNENTMVGLCVLGGIFSEGIDLKNERLIGSIVVGTGLPQVCTEREILKKYYSLKNCNGFDYAYRYPGINKVLQAAGRVIRTADDYGVIGLLDDRFLQSEYGALYPREWNDLKVVNIGNVDDEIKRFWKYL